MCVCVIRIKKTHNKNNFARVEVSRPSLHSNSRIRGSTVGQWGVGGAGVAVALPPRSVVGPVRPRHGRGEAVVGPEGERAQQVALPTQGLQVLEAAAGDGGSEATLGMGGAACEKRRVGLVDAVDEAGPTLLKQVLE